MVKELEKYDIDIMGLSEKQHVFEFESGARFFQEMNQEVMSGGHFQTTMTLDKSSTMIQLGFRISGVAKLICDRSLEEFDESVDTEGRIILKFGEENLELTDEISLIHRNTHRINVAGYIFEFIALAIPMKKIHPRLRDEDELEDDSDGVMVYVSGGESQDEPQEEASEAVDPRWAALKELSKKK